MKSLFFILLAASANLSALTFEVNSFLDAVDNNVGNGVCASSASVCTLRAAIMEANSTTEADVISLPAGTYTFTIAPSGANTESSGDLNIAKPVTIRGAGIETTTINADLLDRVFRVESGATLKIEDLKITQGNADILGASFGGAVYNEGTGKLTVSNVNFLSNKASTGGAVYAKGDVEFNTTKFISNNALISAGALYVDGNTTITGADFLTNSAVKNAAFELKSKKTSMTGTNIKSNVSTGNGIAEINVSEADGSQVILDGLDFEDNTSRGNNLFIQNAKSLKLTKPKFINNTATVTNGAGLVYSSTDSTLDISRATFKDNTSEGNGAGLYLIGSITGDIAGSFSKNEGKAGSAILIDGATKIFLKNSSLIDNKSTTGAVYITGAARFISQFNYFLNNTSSSNGGAIVVNSVGDFTVSESGFRDNISNGGAGGAVYMSGSNNQFVIEKSYFVRNKAVNATAASGGALYLDAVSGNIGNDTFSANAAESTTLGSGGAIYHNAGINNLNSNTFKDNSASTNASSIFVNAGLFNINTTIVEDGSAVTNCQGTLTSQGYNISDDASCNLSATGDLQNTSAMLAPLTTKTGGFEFDVHPINPGSPALDAYTGGLCPATDQRGAGRLFDGNQDGVNRCDIGSFESIDGCINDPLKDSPGFCGCGTADVDTNANNVADCFANADIKMQTLFLKVYIAQLKYPSKSKTQQSKYKASKTKIKSALNSLKSFSAAHASDTTLKGTLTLNQHLAKISSSITVLLNSTSSSKLSANKVKASAALKNLGDSLWQAIVGSSKS